MNNLKKRVSSDGWYLLAAALAIVLLAFPHVEAAFAGSLAERFASHAIGAKTRVEHSVWTALLQRYVVPGEDGLNRVDYARFRDEAHGPLKTYLSDLQRVQVSSLDRPEQFAFWVNLYNAATIDIVLDFYPVKSIREIGSGLFSRGPWNEKLVTVDGVELSLNDIEHEILRPLWRDARVHYAVNCASIGCPNLARQAYTGAQANKMLETAARAYVNSPRGARVEKERLVVSSIYHWYGEDFGGSQQNLIAHLRRFSGRALAQQLQHVTRVADHSYDWRLNDAK